MIGAHPAAGRWDRAPSRALLRGRAARSRLLDAIPGVTHGITGRVVGLGRADGNLGYGPPRDPTDAWHMRRLWCDAIEVDPAAIVALRQVHGGVAVIAHPADAGRGAVPGSEPLATADALVATGPGPALLTLHADCLPILLADRRARTVAAVHAGWRGTVADVAGNTVAAMSAAAAVDPRDLIAFLGPAICRSCYEVGDAVAEPWIARAGSTSDALDREGSTWRFDLRLANRWLLARAGVPPGQIEISDECTRCGGSRWFSHRGQGATTGRFGAIIALTPPAR